MTAEQIIFYILSAFVLAAALFSVTTRKVFRAAIALLFCLMGVAGLYFWMQVNFIAAVQIIVYVGGIVVLIIFSVFLTQQSGSELPKPIRSRSLFSILAILFGFALTYNLICNNNYATIKNKPFEVDVADIGTQMLSTTHYGYILPFEVVSMLLLAAMIGCIVIAMKTTPETINKNE